MMERGFLKIQIAGNKKTLAVSGSVFIAITLISICGIRAISERCVREFSLSQDTTLCLFKDYSVQILKLGNTLDLNHWEVNNFRNFSQSWAS